MIASYVIGISGIVALMVTWIGVQTLWRKIFSEHVTDEDALAERTKCDNCGCTTACENKVGKLPT
jgi:hypothetical protein